VLDTPTPVLGTLGTRLASLVHTESGVEGVRHTNTSVRHTLGTRMTRVVHSQATAEMLRELVEDRVLANFQTP